MRLAELGGALGWERSRLHHQLTRVGRRGLVDRGPMSGAQDAAVQARLTDPGLAAIREARRHHLRDVRELVVDVLDDQRLAQLGDVSTELLAAFAAHPQLSRR
jgi:DNA-binding MarR family transcriptional regulator